MEWVLLSYRIPREPSTPRITVWRKLERVRQKRRRRYSGASWSGSGWPASATA